MSERVEYVGYMRVSGKDQIDGDGFYRQKDTIESFCKQHGLNCFTYLREEGVSGALEALDRPALSAVFDQWTAFPETRPVAIIVERLDRLARELMVQECALRDFRRLGVKVYAADHGLVDMANDSDDPTRTLIRQIFGALAQWEKAVTVRKLCIARARVRAEKGHCEGARKWGQRPGEKPILDEILSLFDMGFRADNIARVLNDKGYRRMRGKHAGEVWTEDGVRSILHRAGRAKYRWNKVAI